MLSLLACIIFASPQIPGAVRVEPVDHKELLKSLSSSSARGPRMARVSEDGQAVFVLADRYRRFLIHDAKAAPEEDLFLSLIAGKPSVHTTSQFAHLTLKERGTSVDKDWPPRIAYAPNKDRLLLGVPVHDDLWLVIVNWNSRGKSPNKTVVVKADANRPKLLSARIYDSDAQFFVVEAGWVSRIKTNGLRTRLGKTPLDAFDYSPQEKALIGLVEGRMSASDGQILRARLGAPKAASFAVPGKPQSRETVFAFYHRNQLFASTDRIYREEAGKWMPYGSKVRLLAISASKKIWLVKDENDQMWKVRF